MIPRINAWLFLVWLVLMYFCQGQATAQAVHPNAHAHNDYEHKRPLRDALDNGFTSMEADVHLIGGTLYVSHGRPKPSLAMTLENLYLKPLDSLSRKHGGSIYEGATAPVNLLLDIKTDGTATLKALVRVLQQYPALFPKESPQQIIRAIVSGNRNYDLIMQEPIVVIDGRPDDLGKGFASEQMPLISDKYSHWTSGSSAGKGIPNPVTLEQIRGLAERVHRENKLLRLWAIPDREEVWPALLDAGVDLINTDHLEQLNKFLTNKGR